MLEKARSLGGAGLRHEARRIISRVVGPARKNLKYDSMGTPFQGNVIYFAQHATAACCRRCAQEWHGIPDDRPLAPSELDYLVELVMAYLGRRLGDLPELGPSGAAA